MEATTFSTSSTVVAALGRTVLSNDETSNAMQFDPIFSISEWANKSRKIVSATILLRSGLQDECVSKVVVSKCNDKLDV